MFTNTSPLQNCRTVKSLCRLKQQIIDGKVTHAPQRSAYTAQLILLLLLLLLLLLSLLNLIKFCMRN